jgi:hypothetical protein
MKGRRQDRQIWVNGTIKECPHSILDEIRTEGGDMLAEVCHGCGVRLVEYGKCNGCGKHGRLAKFDGPRRFHDGRCLTAWNEAKKAEKKLAEKQPERSRGEGGWRS